MQSEQLDNRIKHIVIVGGGTAGWMSAAALSKVIGTQNVKITLVESEEIGTIGVGEATIPQLAIFNNVLGVNEDEFVKATQGTFKLGIEFINWGKIGDSYIHPFSTYGTNIDNIQFYHYWQKAFKLGLAPDIGSYSIAIQASLNQKFMRPANIANSPLSKIAYAYHFDAGLYAKFLRGLAEKKGVERVEGKVESVATHVENGFIKSLQLASGQVLEADFFLDCTGFKGLLIEGVLNSGYQDWSDLLPCDSAVAVPCKKTGPAIPYTKSTAHSAGWQWRIPLQHRTGNGHVYSSRFMDDEEAKRILLENLDGEPLMDPKLIRFKTGKRNTIWKKNCLAVGLSSGFMEPLESTSIHLVQSTISKFLGLFPTKECHQIEVDKFNQQLDEEFIGIRDFLVLHYYATERDDSDFWNYCRTMDVPDSLKNKMALYKTSSRMYRENNELFDDISWLAVMHGQRIPSYGYNPIVDSMPVDELSKRMMHIKDVVDKCVEAMPVHEDFIAQNCKAQSEMI